MKFRHILVTLLILGVVALFVPGIGFRRSVTRWNEIHCSGNLEGFRPFGMMYADKRDGYLPHSPNGPIATLQVLVDAFPQDFRPEHFVCRDGNENPAPLDGELQLTTKNCSYQTVPWRLKSSEKDAILFFDSTPRHRGGRLVVLTDGDVLFMDEDTFQRRFQEERVRFSAATNPRRE